MLGSRLPWFTNGAVTLYGPAFQQSYAPMVGRNPSPHTTFPHTRRVRVRFVLLRFQSPLLAESRLISFPAGTKMLQFPASPFPDCSGNRMRKSHSGISGSKPACGSPELCAACRALHRLPSQVIHQWMFWSLLCQDHPPMRSSKGLHGVHVFIAPDPAGAQRYPCAGTRRRLAVAPARVIVPSAFAPTTSLGDGHRLPRCALAQALPASRGHRGAV